MGSAPSGGAFTEGIEPGVLVEGRKREALRELRGAPARLVATAGEVDAADELERLAGVPLSIVCVRANPGDRSEEHLHRLNRRLGDALLEDGRYYAGTTTYGGRVALRPALVNWRTREEDVDGFVEVVRELVARLA